MQVAPRQRCRPRGVVIGSSVSAAGNPPPGRDTKDLVVDPVEPTKPSAPPLTSGISQTRSSSARQLRALPWVLQVVRAASTAGRLPSSAQRLSQHLVRASPGACVRRTCASFPADAKADSEPHGFATPSQRPFASRIPLVPGPPRSEFAPSSQHVATNVVTRLLRDPVGCRSVTLRSFRPLHRSRAGLPARGRLHDRPGVGFRSTAAARCAALMSSENTCRVLPSAGLSLVLKRGCWQSIGLHSETSIATPRDGIRG